VIFQAGEFVRETGVVVSGKVHMVKRDAWGNSNIITEISDGGMFAESLVFGGVGLLPMSAIAAEDSEIMLVDVQRMVTQCTAACAFHNLMIRNLIGILARRNVDLSGKMEHMTKRTTREKLMSYLSEQARLNQSSEFDIPFDRQELADYLSVERSALSATMSKLRDEGLINYRKNHFEMLALDKR